MKDLTWMLKPQAIRLAKQCTDLIYGELGLRIKLSDPEFIHRLHEAVRKSRSPRLNTAYSRLIKLADSQELSRLLSTHSALAVDGVS